MNKESLPIANPEMIYPGLVLYKITINKVSKKDSNRVTAVIGNEIHYAAIDTLKVKSVELNEGETGVIVNKTTDNVRIMSNPSDLPSEKDGALFDTEEKAAAVAKSINSVNVKKAESFIEQMEEAKGFLQQLIDKGA